MASSYTTSFVIEEMGSGDQSGAWGTTTNYNWNILDRIKTRYSELYENQPDLELSGSR